MPENSSHERTTPGERLRHWLTVITLTLLGLLVAEFPVLSHTRDRVYLWLQERLVRSHKTVVVLAIDDEEFWRRELGGNRPLNRWYLKRLLVKIADANPAAIGLDVGFETNNPDVPPQWERLSEDEKEFLEAVEAVAKRCPVIVPQTISGDERFISHYDLFDAKKFDSESVIAFGYTSSARDSRQIPTRVIVDGDKPLDSFALAVVRRVMRELPAKVENKNQPWPYSFFLPNSTFVPKGAPVGPDGLMPVSALWTATPAQTKKWLERQIVLVGGTWRNTAHGGEFADAHVTPRGSLPGVVVHANYVQSLLWDAMYPMPRHWRLAVEISLGLAVSVFFLIAHGWRRLALVLGTLVTVVVLTWVFSSAIGVFFDMVVPVAFLGVHAVWEGASERLRLEFRQRFRYAEHVFTMAAVLAVSVTGVVFGRHEMHTLEKQLKTEDRLQVTTLAPPASPGERGGGDLRYASTDTASLVVPNVAPPKRTRELPKPEPPREVPELERNRGIPEQQRLAEEPHKSRSFSAEQSRIAEASSLQQALEEQQALLERIEEEQRVLEQIARERPRHAERSAEEERAHKVPVTTQNRVRLVDARAATGLFAKNGPAILTVAIEHEAALNMETELIAFAEPQGQCAQQLIESMVPSFTASGSLVIEPPELHDMVGRLGLTADRARARRIGNLVGPGSLVFLKVRECKNDLRAEREVPRFSGAKPSMKYGTIKVLVQIVDLATGVTETSRSIDASATLDQDEIDRSLKDRALSEGSAITKDPMEMEKKIRQTLVADAAEQVHHLFFAWTERTQLPLFNDRECQLQDALTQLQDGDIGGAAVFAQVSLDLCNRNAGTKAGMLAKAHYNAGITSFLARDFSGAVSHLEQAQKLDRNEVFEEVAALFKLVRTEALDAGRHGLSPTSRPPSLSREERLRRLENLHRNGLITTEEYERKRKEIVGHDPQ